jgi:hypothetical protein
VHIGIMEMNPEDLNTEVAVKLTFSKDEKLQLM